MAEQTTAVQKRAAETLPVDLRQKLQAIDQTAHTLHDLVTIQDGSPTAVVAQAYAMQQLRELLTEDVMKPIMALQKNRLGFLTDKDKIKKRGADGKTYYEEGPGYPMPVVRDVTIWALGRGANMTGNEVNILGSNGYLTKSFFARHLDGILGAGCWFFVHAVPQVKRDSKGRAIGATVETLVKWMVALEWQEETLTHAIKGDAYASVDSYNGKADRKCGAWLLARVSGRRFEDGEADDSDVIETTATPVQDDKAPSDFAQRLRDKVKDKQTEQKPEAGGNVTPFDGHAPAAPPEDGQTVVPTLTERAGVVPEEERCRACKGVGKSTAGRQCRVCHGAGVEGAEATGREVMRALEPIPHTVVLGFFRAFEEGSPYRIVGTLEDMPGETLAGIVKDAAGWKSRISEWQDSQDQGADNA